MSGFAYGKLWEQMEDALEQFHNQFKRNYFAHQQRDTQKHGETYNLEVGDVICDVSRKTDRTDYENWPLGIVVKADPDEKGVVRRVIIRRGTTRTLVSRSAAHIVRMEALDEETKEILRRKKILLSPDVELTEEQLAEIADEARRNEEKDLERERILEEGLERAKTITGANDDVSGVMTRVQKTMGRDMDKRELFLDRLLAARNSKRGFRRYGPVPQARSGETELARAVREAFGDGGGTQPMPDGGDADTLPVLEDVETDALATLDEEEGTQDVAEEDAETAIVRRKSPRLEAKDAGSATQDAVADSHVAVFQETVAEAPHKCEDEMRCAVCIEKYYSHLMMFVC